MKGPLQESNFFIIPIIAGMLVKVKKHIFYKETNKETKYLLSIDTIKNSSATSASNPGLIE